MGHSRGGEAVRAAYNLYLDPNIFSNVDIGPDQTLLDLNWPELIESPVKFQGIFEIGPVDGFISNRDGSRVLLNAVGTSWGVLLPMCDGDVANHQGMKPLDRMIGLRGDDFIKVGLIVLGTNHNTYNTEWQQSDSINCMQHRRLFPRNGVSEDTQATAILSILPFFLATVGENKHPELIDFFNPSHPLPEEFTSITPAQRVFLQYGGKVVSNFDDTSDNEVGDDVEVQYRSYPYQHASDLLFARAKWSNGGSSSYLTVPFSGGPVTVDDYTFLEFRSSRECEEPSCSEPSSGNPKVLDFSVSLQEDSGEWTHSVSLQHYTPLLRLYGTKYGVDSRLYHPSLESVRIPLRDFDVSVSTIISKVKFTFDKSPNSVAWIANIALGKGEVPREVTSSSVSPTTYDEEEPEDISIVNDNGETVEPYATTVTGNGSITTVKVCSNYQSFVRNQVHNYVILIGPEQFPTNIDPEDTYCMLTDLTSEDYKGLFNGTIHIARKEEFELTDKRLVGELLGSSAAMEATACEGFNTNKQCTKKSNGNCEWDGKSSSCVVSKTSALALSENIAAIDEAKTLDKPNSGVVTTASAWGVMTAVVMMWFVAH